jgi:hypothetical protein
MRSLHYLSAIVIITTIILLVYASVQQNFRSNANDPQIQIAHDLKTYLENGKPANALFSDTIDLARSLAVFKSTYDHNGKPIQSTGYLNGKLPQLPSGVFNYVRNNGEDWVTWQPEPNVRLAMGILKVSSFPISYIAVGRSLKEVEERTSRLINMAVISWILCVGVILINWLVYYYYVKRSPV